jgi:hypothetical protein
LSQEQVPSLHIQHLPNRLRFTLQQKIARAAQFLTKLQYVGRENMYKQYSTSRQYLRDGSAYESFGVSLLG